MVLRLQKIKFFFYPITRFAYCELEGLARLRGTLQIKAHISGSISEGGGANEILSNVGQKVVVSRIGHTIIYQLT